MKIIITESQYKLIKENENFEETLIDLIKTGEKENIEMAFLIAQGQDIDLKEIVEDRFVDLLWLKGYGSTMEELLSFFNETTINLDNTGLKLEQLELLCGCKKLEFISLENNDLETLPDCFTNLKNLKTLMLSYNKFTEFPKIICELENLDWLVLSDNHIQTIPKCISNLNKLEILAIRRNNLSQEEKNNLEELLPNPAIRF